MRVRDLTLTIASSFPRQGRTGTQPSVDCAKVDATTAAALIAPAPEALLECYQVSPAANRVANDSPELIAPAAAAPPAAKAPAAAAKLNKPNDQPSLF